MTRLFEKEYGLPVNSNPTDPRSRVRTFRMAALCSPIIASRQHRLHSSNRCVGRTLTPRSEPSAQGVLSPPTSRAVVARSDLQ